MARTVTKNVKDQMKRDEEERKKREEEKAKNLGLTQTAKITPAAVAADGGNKDQMKMAGTPQQKTPALQQAAQQNQRLTDQDQTLQTYQEEKTYENTAADIAAKQAAEFSEKMAPFGSLGKRYEDLVAKSAGAMSGESIATFEVDDTALKTMMNEGYQADDTKVAEARGVITEMQQLFGSGKQAEAFTLLKNNADLFGAADSTNVDSALFNKFMDLFPDEESQRGLAASMVSDGFLDPEQLTFQQLTDEGIITDLYNDLGVTAEDIEMILGPKWMEMTPNDINRAVSEQREQQLNRVGSIKEQLNNPNLDPVVRQGLEEELQRLGAMGVINTEQEAYESVRNAKDMTKMVIGGEVKDVREFLKDENVNTLVTEFLTASPERRAEMLKEAEGDEIMTSLYEWSTKNEEELKALTGKIEGGVQRFADIQAANADFFDNGILKDGMLNDEVIVAMGFSGGWQDHEYTMDDTEITKALKGLVDTKGPEIEAFFNGLPSDYYEELGSLSAAEAKKIATAIAGGKSANVLNTLKAKSIMKAGATPETVIKAMFGGRSDGTGIDSPEEMNIHMNKLALRAEFGDKKAAAELATLEKYFTLAGTGVSLDQKNIDELTKDVSLKSMGEPLGAFIEDAVDDPDLDISNKALEMLYNQVGENGIMPLSAGGKETFLTDINTRGLGEIEEMLGIMEKSGLLKKIGMVGADFENILNEKRDDKTEIEVKDRAKDLHMTFSSIWPDLTADIRTQGGREHLLTDNTFAIIIEEGAKTGKFTWADVEEVVQSMKGLGKGPMADEYRKVAAKLRDGYLKKMNWGVARVKEKLKVSWLAKKYEGLEKKIAEYEKNHDPSIFTNKEAYMIFNHKNSYSKSTIGN